MCVRIGKAAVFSLLLLLLSVPLRAQAWAGKGRLQGLIKDQQGHPIEGAKVTLRPGAPPVKAEAPGPAPLTTNKEGKWTILGLTGGSWGVLIEKDGYMVSEGQIQVNEFGSVPPIIIELKPAPKEVPREPSEAQKKAQQAVELIQQGNAALQAGQTAEAREAYLKSLDLLEPANKPDVLRAIARTYYDEASKAKTKQEKNAKLEEAIGALKQALAIKPDDSDAAQLLASALMDVGKQAEAQTYIAGKKISADTLISVGIKFYNDKKLDKALEQFSRAVQENPQLADAYYYRGLVYLNMSKVPEAKADFQKLLEIDPNSKFAPEVREYLKSL
ncbi:MAG TPA: tetratricopeptide repeat protein [Thermoanaerobaculia bacterium]|nr:tetratricopeptide repeat protein [Thermoanaerobaculia bacterium]